MTDRERWIVYPLLALALGTSLRSHITGSLDLHEIRCKTLRCDQVVGRELDTACQTLVCDHVVAVDAGAQRIKAREIEVVAGDGKVRLLLTSEGQKAEGGGALVAFSPQGQPEASLRALASGGLIEAVVDQKRRLVRSMGVLGDRIQEFRPIETGKDDKTKQPAAASEGKSPDAKTAAPKNSVPPTGEPAGDKPDTGKPETDKPTSEKPATAEPAAATPDGKPEPDQAPTDEKKPTDDKPPADTPGDN